MNAMRLNYEFRRLKIWEVNSVKIKTGKILRGHRRKSKVFIVIASKVGWVDF